MVQRSEEQQTLPETLQQSHPGAPTSTATSFPSIRFPADVFERWGPLSQRRALPNVENHTQIIDLRDPALVRAAPQLHAPVSKIRKRWITNFEPKTELCWLAGPAALKRGLVHGRFGSVVTTTYWPPEPNERGQLGRLLKDNSPALEWSHGDESRARRLDGISVLVDSPGSASNYYHWLLETMPRIWALRDLVSSGTVDWIAISHGCSASYHRDALAQLLPDDVANKVVFLDHAPTRFESLAFFENHRGMSRTSDLSLSFVREMRELLATSSEVERIYVLRGTTSKRRLLDEAALWDELEPLGFWRIDGTGLTVKQQVSAFMAARAVLGVHGAGLSNALFARPDAVFLELTSSSFVRRRTFSDMGVALGMRTIVAILDEVGTYVDNQKCPDLRFPSDRARARLLDVLAG